jgi:Fe-S-cluster formation regulator IscX/YfhJ
MMDEIDESDPRYVFFARLRELIMEKDLENDEVAAAVLGWAYERLAE